MIMRYSTWKLMQLELEKHNQSLIPVNINLIDLIWENQPLPPNSIVEPLPLNYTGKVALLLKSIFLRFY